MNKYQTYSHEKDVSKVSPSSKFQQDMINGVPKIELTKLLE